jgi:signal transduction histidine kinase
VLQNLLENSIKYTPEYGVIEINIEMERNNFLGVRVKDNGVGIPDQDKAKLFSKFFRASNVIRMETEGTGLGLFIAKNIVEKHGGSVSIASEEGKGTEVGFTLPVNSNI